MRSFNQAGKVEELRESEGLMQDVYHLHEMERGISTAEALRRAQLALLEGTGDPSRARFAHPYFWAPFILIGNWK
jgi:CHAT domain-containing protein